MRIVCECSDCGGTGLYSGMREGKGNAVVCVGCEGSGAQVITLKKYTGRKKCTGIKKINFSRGRSILSCGATGDSMTYQQFKQKIKPYPVD